LRENGNPRKRSSSWHMLLPNGSCS